jgi:hypothetical protein
MKRVLLLAGALLLLTATPALAQYETPGVITNPATLTPGGTVGVTACCFAPGSVVTFSVGGNVIGTAVAGPDGTASGTFTVPGNLAAGVPAVITASNGTTSTNSGAVPVNGSTTSPTTARVGGLPVTGSGTALPLSLAAAVLLAGGALAVVAGRRRSADTSNRS